MKGEPIKISKLKTNLKKETSILKSVQSLINIASAKFEDLIKPEIKTISKFKDKTINKIKDKVEEHENMRFILFAVTGGLVGLALYLAK
jgi:hypothetical protein